MVIAHSPAVAVLGGLLRPGARSKAKRARPRRFKAAPLDVDGDGMISLSRLLSLELEWLVRLRDLSTVRWIVELWKVLLILMSW